MIAVLVPALSHWQNGISAGYSSNRATRQKLWCHAG